MKLMQRMTSTIVRPGNVTSHHAVCETFCPSLMRLPRDGVGGCTPKPRNDSAASVRIARPTVSVALTTIGPSAFGSMCRSMIRRSPDPAAFAASTYSFSRSERKLPRTIRASCVQKSSASMNAIRYCLPLPRNAAAVSRTASGGSVSTRSVERMRRLSTQRP